MLFHFNFNCLLVTFWITSQYFHSQVIIRQAVTENVNQLFLNKSVFFFIKRSSACIITKEDICRSHPVGKANRLGNRQIICRFRNWKIKNEIFLQEKNLKGDTDRIFVTEDLTRFRQGVVDEASKAKKAGKIHSYWTSDGRIFVKLGEKDRKILIHSIHDLHDVAPPSIPTRESST